MNESINQHILIPNQIIIKHTINKPLVIKRLAIDRIDLNLEGRGSEKGKVAPWLAGEEDDEGEEKQHKHHQ